MGKKVSTLKQSRGDVLSTAIMYFLLSIVLVVTVYPLYFVLIASVSDPIYVNSGSFMLFPKGFTTLGYTRVFSDTRIWVGYANTIIYVLCGTSIGVISSLMAGYSLSRKDLPYRNIIMGLMVFTMYFSGGLIPLFYVVKSLNLTDTRTILIILGSISVYNIIIIRSFFTSTLPDELREAAFIDGCGNARFFFSIVMPLSKAIVAVISLYLAVTYWNSYFNALIFITGDKTKYPLQLYLREILLTAQTASAAPSTGSDSDSAIKLEKMVEVIKYGVIVVSTLPIICVYPFLQKYFVQGVMIGAIKG